MIVVGGILATASHGVTINGMFWMMTVARGIVGFGKYFHLLHYIGRYHRRITNLFFQSQVLAASTRHLQPRPPNQLMI